TAMRSEQWEDHALFLVTSRPEGTRALTLDGLARCRDTDDTNRGYRDTRTIRWLTKMSSDQMSIDWPPKHRPPSEWRHETVPTEPPSTRSYWPQSKYGSCSGQ